jgi:hypothetical protein
LEMTYEEAKKANVPIVFRSVQRDHPVSTNGILRELERLLRFAQALPEISALPTSELRERQCDLFHRVQFLWYK